MADSVSVSASSKKTVALYNGRKFSDYNNRFLEFNFKPDGASFWRPRDQIDETHFRALLNLERCIIFNDGIKWVDISYVSDTSVSIQSQLAGTFKTILNVINWS